MITLEVVDIEEETIDAGAVEVLPPAVRDPQAVNLFGDSSPTAVVERATEVANALSEVIEQKNLYTQIQRRKHVNVEGWTLLGSMLGVFPIVEWTRQTDDGWEARVVARTLSGADVGAAEAMCSRRESSWKNRDDYAIRSMAQTRAVSKALRHPLGFIMTLAGYEATPEAEISEVAPAADQPAGLPKPQSWKDVEDLLTAYTDDGATYHLFQRFGSSARKLLFADADLTEEQKAELFSIAARTAYDLRNTVDASTFPPPSESDIATAWAKYLDGAILEPSPEKGD